MTGQVYPVIAEQPMGHNSVPNGAEPITNQNGITRRVPTLTMDAITFTGEIAAGVAGADLEVAKFAVPAGHRLFIKSVELIALGTAVGIDAANTCVVALKNITTSVNMAVKTFNNVVVFPDANEATSLTLASNVEVKANEVLGVNVTQGATADHQGFLVQVIGLIEKL
jgi:hypothetical protein